jgi:hypothetical protein
MSIMTRLILISLVLADSISNAAETYSKPVEIERLNDPSTRYIEHPNAEKGLIRIDKDRNYLYDVKPSEQNQAASVRIGSFDPTELSNPEYPQIEYSTVYAENNFPMVHYEHEKYFFKSFGRMAYTFGFGFFFAKGTGQFIDAGASPSEPPLEEFSLLAFPLSAGLQYRLQFWDNQFFVPYVGGGFDLFTFMEYRDDDNNPGIGVALGAAPAAHFQGGGAFRLGRGARDFLDLDREYGINSMWIVAEYRRFEGLSDKYDFSSDFIGGGIFLEY